MSAEVNGRAKKNARSSASPPYPVVSRKTNGISAKSPSTLTDR